MAITSIDGWFGAARQSGTIRKTSSVATVSTQWHTLWNQPGQPGSGNISVGETTSGLVPTQATVGAPAINTVGAATAYLARGVFRNNVAGGLILYDRLFHAGSFSMTSLTTTNLTAQPSYAGRVPDNNYSDNIEIWLEINAAVSATATTIAVQYTNQSGTTGRTTGATASLSSFATGRIIRMPLQAGDSGVQKIEGVTVGGTVATTGTFNVIVARIIGEFDLRMGNGTDAQSWDMLGSPIIYDTSCLATICCTDASASGYPSLNYTIISG